MTIVLAALVPGVQIDGAWLDAEAARARGLVLTETKGSGGTPVNMSQ
ncbi:MAG: hypothetical protein IKB76_06055 [Kiritimatiellae bacterium]|nr:hypothetical protein [Kiritimatiellia bacterium]